MLLSNMVNVKSVITELRNANRIELDQKWQDKYPNGRYLVQVRTIRKPDGTGDIDHIINTLAKEVHREPWRDLENRQGIVISDDLIQWMRYYRGELPDSYAVINGFIFEKRMNNHWASIKYFDNREEFLVYARKKKVSEEQINTFLELDK